MTSKTIEWATVSYTGEGNGTIVISADANPLHSERSLDLTVRSLTGGIERAITVRQAAKPYIDLSAAVVTASAQTYDGSAKTPAPTVTLNGEVVDSSNYDVAYSNNTNAGNATITVTGKGDYTGTASGTFTINKAAPTYSAPSARSGLIYSGGSQYLTTAGSTSHGTIQYSEDGSTWSTTRKSKTNAGSYTTYWRLMGDGNHTDVGPTSLTTSIAKASRTLSFADSSVVLDTNSNVTKTATPSAGSGDGSITYGINSTTYATVNSSSGKVTSKSSDGSAVVTATIAEGTNYLSASTSYNLYVFATTHDFSYTGSVQSITLPPGSYQLQCWGAQGGTNAAYSAYGITANAGGKGGYSVGVLTLSSERTIYAFVGGQGGTSGNGGWNGGGGCCSGGVGSYDSGGHLGYTRHASGGGATDFALTTSSMSYSSSRTNRSSASLLSRMIVAGGGCGGSGAYKRITSTTQGWSTLGTTTISSSGSGYIGSIPYSIKSGSYSEGSRRTYYIIIYFKRNLVGNNVKLRFKWSGSHTYICFGNGANGGSEWESSSKIVYSDGSTEQEYTTVSSGYSNLYIDVEDAGAFPTGTLTVEKYGDIEVYTEDYMNQAGFAGGGASGVGSYAGSQRSAAAAGSAFGLGGQDVGGNTRYVPGGGGAGWYGGGRGGSDSYLDRITENGGGSGFVNTAANAGSRPSGYTGLQLDSGSTTAGTSSFPAPGGGNETGHAGNGYARITRLS